MFSFVMVMVVMKSYLNAAESLMMMATEEEATDILDDVNQIRFAHDQTPVSDDTPVGGDGK